MLFRAPMRVGQSIHK